MIWDDHEIANNAHQTGAQNHQDDEGDYMTRKMTAKKHIMNGNRFESKKEMNFIGLFNLVT